jgi:transposase-like protein
MKSKNETFTSGSCEGRNGRRYFKESARRQIVKEIESGLSKAEAARKYEVSQTTIFKWYSKYSVLYEKSLVMVVEHASDSDKVKRLERELEQTYASLGRKDIELKYLEALLVEAGAHFGVDLKKNFAPKS